MFNFAVVGSNEYSTFGHLVSDDMYYFYSFCCSYGVESDSETLSKE